MAPAKQCFSIHSPLEIPVRSLDQQGWITVPAVGYTAVVVETGMITPVVVSPTSRVAVKLPRLDVPVVDSCPSEAPLMVRCVLPDASPVTVRELLLVSVVDAVRMVDVSPSRRPADPRPRP